MKNRFIISAVFILPLALYWCMANFMPETAQNFKNAYQVEAKKAQGAMLIKFSTPLCMDCQKLDRTLEKVMPEFKNNVELKRIDASSNKKEVQELIKKYQVTVVPSTIFINSKGEFAKKIEGDIPEQKLKAEIKALF